MTFEQTLAFILFSVVAAITPGPSNIMLTATGAAVGIGRGIPCLLGVSAGMGLLMFSVAIGLGNLILSSPAILRAMNWGGSAFLLWLSWKIATSPPSDANSKQEPVGFVEATLFQLVNPKSWLVSTAAIGAYLQAAEGHVFIYSVILAGLFVIAALPSGLVWLVFGATMQTALSNARTARIFNIIMGLLLAGSLVLTFHG